MSVSLALLAAELERRLPRSAAEVVPGGPLDDRANQIADVTHDSNQVSGLPSPMFCCIPGLRRDGHDFAGDAVASGAVALLVERPLRLAVPQLQVRDVREAAGHVASIVHGDPVASLDLVGITGTNGKTTTAHLLGGVLREDGRHVAVLGTLTQTRTTPEATDLHRRLAALRSEGVTDVVMEVTSHALELHRVAGCHFKVSAFTNLSQDHLDFHGTMEAYFRAKAKLFVPEYSDHAFVNLDDLYGSLLNDSAVIPTSGVRLSDAEDVVLRPHGSTFRWRGVEISLPMAGDFNVRNAILVAAVAKHLGASDAALVSGLSSAAVPGRYEMIDEGQSFAVVVDYAHTPDGLGRVLQAARRTVQSPGVVIAVFGCGGDRDRGKRPMMGQAAVANADRVIVTTDNPRSESPTAIIGEILAGMSSTGNVQVIEDRREAVANAIGTARSGDVVVIAGKGHETGQERDGVITPFDDREVAREALQAISGRTR